MVECTRGSVFTIALFAFIFFTLVLYYNSLPSELNNEILELNIYTNHSNKIFDLYLKYEINSNKCAEKNLLAVIIVTSYFGNVETRSAMRRAFSSEMLRKYNISRVFLLGKGNGDKYVRQSAIEDEAERFQDIIQGNFNEAYRNLTYKHIMGLKWASENCKTAKYIVKMDDDIVVNMKKFINFLQTTKMPNRHLLAGYLLQGMKPIRLKANKWYVTEKEYSKSTYPTFLSGWFYITNPSTSSKLVTLTIYKPYFWIDDTYVTGILAQLLRIRHFNIGKYFTVHPEFLECCIRDAKKGLNCDLMIGPNGGDNNLFYDFNEALKDCPENCTDRKLSLNQTCVAEKKFNLGKGTSVIRNYKLV